MAGVELSPNYFGVVGEVEEGVRIDSIRVMKLGVARGCIIALGGVGKDGYATVRLHALSASKLRASIVELSLKFIGHLLGYGLIFFALLIESFLLSLESVFVVKFELCHVKRPQKPQKPACCGSDCTGDESGL